MKIIFKIFCLSYLVVSCVVIFADDSPLKQLGESVDLDAKALLLMLPRRSHDRDMSECWINW